MAIPDYQSIMLPLLQFYKDGQEHSLRETIDALATQYHLTDEERNELLPSGQQSIFDNRVGWARTYLKKAGLLIAIRRGYLQITERGKQVLKQNPSAINIEFLKQFPEFAEFQSKKNTPHEPPAPNPPIFTSKTPKEAMEEAYQVLQEELITELLQTIKQNSPQFFERLVINLLVKMGYGGTQKDAGQILGKSGDEGIDGIIKEDRLGLDVVYIQAKRWDGVVVGRQEIQKFVGALHGQQAKKGIFITTSNFSKGATEYVAHIDTKVVLIDGEMLAQLMIDYNIGVATVATYELKRIDSDYFNEE